MLAVNYLAEENVVPNVPYEEEKIWVSVSDFLYLFMLDFDHVTRKIKTHRLLIFLKILFAGTIYYL